MALPGVNARDIRTKFASVLQRFFAGDPGLVGEIFDNNQSSAPIHQVARDDLAAASGNGAEIMTPEEARLMQFLAKRNLIMKNERRIQLNDEKREMQNHVKRLKTEENHARTMTNMEIEKLDKQGEIAKLVADEEERRTEAIRKRVELLREEQAIKNNPGVAGGHPTPPAVSQNNTPNISVVVHSPPPASQSPPQDYQGKVTMSRVLKHILAEDEIKKIPEKELAKFLIKMGKMAADFASPLPTKSPSLFSRFEENEYPPTDYHIISDTMKRMAAKLLSSM